MGEERIIPAPPLPRHREGDILDEVPIAAAPVLWQDVRHVRDWAESTPQVRAVLFNPPTGAVLTKRGAARACVAELIRPLDVFAAMKASPLQIQGPEVGAACEAVVTWALEHDYTQTAIEWAEVGALADLENPRRANLAGRVNRNAGEYDRAELWFKRGIGYARDRGDVVEQVWGHLGYGKLCQELGRVSGARRHLNRGSRLAWQDGPPSLAASAQHDLAAMLMVRGHLTEAAERARRALRWYPKNHPRIPFFAADVALMLVLGRRFGAAARLLRAVLRTVQQPSARTAIQALTARAFAGAGEPEESAVHRRRAFKLLEKHRAMEPVTRWHLADALRLAGNWEGAEAEARTTLAVAIEQNDPEIERLTRILIRLIESRREAPARTVASTEFREFVRELLDRVAGWTPRRGRDWPGPWGENRAA